MQQSSVNIEAEIPLLRNTHVATLKALYKEYTVSFEVKPTSFFLNNFSFTNVIHLIAGGDEEMYEDRNPGVWFYPNYYFSKGALYISPAVKNSVDKTYEKQALPLFYWSSIKIKQMLVDCFYNYSITINNTLIYSTINVEAVELSNVIVYAADPWYPAQIGSIRNLMIISTPGSNTFIFF